MLFSGKEEKDKAFLIEALRGFGTGHGLDRIQVHEDRLSQAIKEMYSVQWRGKLVSAPQHASIFKKVGAFVTSFCKHCPIVTQLPEEIYGEFCSHQNAIFAYSTAVEILYGAEFFCETRRGWIILKEKINPSAHTLQELIAVLSKSNPETHFAWASLMFESLLYQVYPDAAYPKKPPARGTVQLISR